jgi:hypothetical protein
MTTTSRPTEDAGDIPLKPREVEFGYAPPQAKPEPGEKTGNSTKKSWKERIENGVLALIDRVRGRGPKKPSLADIIEPAPWKITQESKGGRYVAMVVMAVGLFLFAYVVFSYHSGAHGGVDQNGYHRTAQMIIDESTTGWRQSDPYEYAGKMNVIIEPYGDARRDNAMTKTVHELTLAMIDRTSPLAAIPARVTPQLESPVPFYTYAKYPFGYPFLAAIGRWFAGFDGMYWVNPLCTVGAVGFAYLMFRQALRRFTSIVGAILLGFNPLTLYYANDGNSHASTLLCVCLGFWGLLSWMRTHSWWKGMLGGFALGYACTIRYSEFLLVLPVAFAAATSLFANAAAWAKGTHPLTGGQRARAMTDWLFPVIGWVIPILVLAIICHNAYGGWGRNGYTYCNEDTGFEWRFMIYGALGMGRGGFGGSNQGNWETLILQMNRTGMFMLWPIAIIGLVGMFSKLPRVGWTLGLWVLPTIFLYMLYYWAPAQETGVGYLRFFVSVIPGLLFAALWVIERAMDSLEGNKWASLASTSIFSLLLFVICAWVLYDNDRKFLLEGDETFLSKTITVTIAAVGTMIASWKGLLIAAGLAVFVALIWWRERGAAAQRTGLALSLGIGAMLACGMNLMLMLPNVENQHTNWTQLRQVVDNVRLEAPTGSVLFTDESTARQLDAIGGYRLYSTDVFGTGGGGGGRGGGGLLGGGGTTGTGGGSLIFASSERIVLSHDRKVETEGEADPNPYQYERARYYMELMGRPVDRRTYVEPTAEEIAFNAQAKLFGIPPLPRKEKVTTEWVSISAAEVQEIEASRWDKAFNEGRKVFYVLRDTGRSDSSAIALARRKGYGVATVASFRTVDPPVETETRLSAGARQGAQGGRGGRGNFQGGGGGGGAMGRGGQQGSWWAIVEITAPIRPAARAVVPTTSGSTPTTTPALTPAPPLPTYKPGSTIFD